MKYSLLILAILTGNVCFGANRVALVIGNSRYAQAPLADPSNDANAIGVALRTLGFTVIQRNDLDIRGMKDAVVSFNRKLGKGDLGLFFFAGHGLQVKGENFLVPLNANLREEFEVPHECLPLNLALWNMEN